PENGRVPIHLSQRSRDYAGVPVPLDDLAARLESTVVERVGELAEAAADIWNKAPLAELSSDNEPSRFPRRTHLTPEAKDCSSGGDDAIDSPQSDPEILDLAELPRSFRRAHTFSRVEI